MKWMDLKRRFGWCVAVPTVCARVTGRRDPIGGEFGPIGARRSALPHPGLDLSGPASWRHPRALRRRGRRRRTQVSRHFSWKRDRNCKFLQFQSYLIDQQVSMDSIWFEVVSALTAVLILNKLRLIFQELMWKKYNSRNLSIAMDWSLNQMFFSRLYFQLFYLSAALNLKKTCLHVINEE